MIAQLDESDRDVRRSDRSRLWPSASSRSPRRLLRRRPLRPPTLPRETPSRRCHDTWPILETRRISTCPCYSTAARRRGSPSGAGISTLRHRVGQRLVRALLVVFVAEPLEAALLGARVGGRRARRPPSDRMKLFVRSVLFRWPTAIRSGRIPSRIHQTDSRDSRPRPCGKRAPVSLRKRSLNPYSANAHSNRRRVASRFGPPTRRSAAQSG